MFLRTCLVSLFLSLVFGLASRSQAQCDVVRTHSGANFGGGTFIVEAGMAQGEACGASYTLTAADFPIKLKMLEAILAQDSTVVPTTTEWSVSVYSGTPATGTLLYEYFSDGDILPHAQLPVGTAGVNIQFSIDPTDPDQMIVNDDGSHTFSIAYRIERHNLPPANPCTTPPNPRYNAFFSVDANGLQHPSDNWLYALDCGPFGAPGGWHKFSDLSVLYRPTGDWNLRVTYESLNPLQITQQPQNQTVSPGSPAIFQVVAAGAGPITYQWTKNNVNLTNGGNIYGSTTDTLFIFPTSAADNGQYRCVVTNPCGSVVSDPASLTVGTPVTISGTVTLQDLAVSPAGKQVQIQVRNPGSTIPLQTQTVTLSASGGYSFNAGSLTAGTYDFACRGATWLRKVRSNVSVSSSGATGVNFSIVNGDIDGDNEIALPDYSRLALSFNKVEGDPGFDSLADLNEDLEVNLADYAILSRNFGQVGDD